MPEIIEISNLSAPGLEVFAKLTEAQLRNRLEPEKGVFIAESVKVIRVALEAGYRPISFLMERKKLRGEAAELLSRCQDVTVYTGPREALAGLTGYELSRGVLCAMQRPALPKAETVCAGARRVAVLENIVDASNVGAIFRSAAALNMDAVLVTPSCSDPFNRRAVRVSMGAVLQVPWARIGETAEDWPGPGLGRLRAMGFRTAALALSDTAIGVEEPCLKREKKLALVLGTEGNGLSPETVARCDYTVKIPMARGVDSLNVAAAAAVAFWELRARE